MSASNDDPTPPVTPPTLPQNDGLVERAEREAELALAREAYEYAPNASVPMPMAASKTALFALTETIPWFEGWLLNQGKCVADLTAWKLKTKTQPTMPDLAAYADVFVTYDTPEIVTTWQDDRIFAAQRLAGLNPTSLVAVTPDGAGPTLATLRRRFGTALTDATLVPFFGAGATLERVVADGRLFVSDYAALGDITADADAPGWQAGQKLVAPIALFARTGDGASLDPVAIALGQNRTYFARDERTAAGDERWAMAKIFVQSADYNYNQLINHLAFTHLLEESICLAMHRRLSHQHPLYRLLVNHFTALLEINQIGVLTLISKTGIISQILEGGLGGSLDLIRNEYGNWTFDALDFPAQIASRGTNDAATLPYYPFRDDGMLVWNLLGNYIDDYLALYYTSDDDVARDYELAGFAGQLAGTTDAGVGRVPGFPSTIETLDQLRETIRRIVWMAGPQHAAVNYPQIDFSTFVPNMSGATFAPPADAAVDATGLLAFLAPKTITEAQVHTSYALAGYQYDRLLDYTLCPADGSQALVTKYFGILNTSIAPTIVQRNVERAATPGLLAYPYLLPANIPNSTSV
jgi:arachidonate 15-lipoxygenase